MSFSRVRPSLSEQEFTILRDLIRDRTGLHYHDGKRELLAERLAGRMAERGFDAFIDYYYLLRYGPGADEEWNHVFDSLSVQETYFWREMDQVRALVDVVVPGHFSGLCVTPLRIWSAACATGEEPLTIAMALQESGWFGRGPIEIMASDGSLYALQKARQGLYRDRAFRSLPEPLRKRYFTQTAAGWQIDPAIHRRVGWNSANLADPAQIQRMLPAHVIFCRNVFIYFSAAAIGRTLRQFFDGMSVPGHLFVGVSEALLRYPHDFELQELGRAFVYVKRQ